MSMPCADPSVWQPGGQLIPGCRLRICFQARKRPIFTWGCTLAIPHCRLTALLCHLLLQGNAARNPQHCYYYFFFQPKRILMQMQGIRRVGAVRKWSAQSWQELAAKFRGVPIVPVSPAPRRHCLSSLRAEVGVPQCCAGRDPEWSSGRVLHQLRREAECSQKY